MQSAVGLGGGGGGWCQSPERVRNGDCGVYADVTLSSGAAATDVPVAFLMQNKILWVSFTMGAPSDAQTDAIRTVPRMGKAYVGAARQSMS